MVKGKWYESTSDDQARKSYKLSEPPVEVHVPLASMITQHDLQFDREGMHERIFSQASHLALMGHNYSNVTTAA